MSLKKDFLRSVPSYVLNKKDHDKRKHQKKVVNDYRILFAVCLFTGLPFSPYNVVDIVEDDCLLTLTSVALNVFRTLLCFFGLWYTHPTYPANSVALSFESFNIFALISTWCLFYKRHKIQKAVRSTLSILYQVRIGKLESKWKIWIPLAIHILGVSVASTALLFVGFIKELQYDASTQSFLGYQFDGDNLEAFMRIVNVAVALSQSMGLASCGVVTLMCSTIYFHLADVVSNFEEKLKGQFQLEERLSLRSLSPNISIFEKIRILNEAVDDALSVSVLMVFGATLCGFLNSVTFILKFNDGNISTFTIVITVISYSTYNFLGIIFTGNRVKSQYRRLRSCIVECSRRVILDNHGEPQMLEFSLLAEDIRSIELCVTGGDLFVIGKELLITVAGVLITYLILVLQIDDL